MASFDFNPSLTSSFQFSPVLDGVTYSAVINWNLFGQRYYVNLYTQQGALVFCLPVIGSPDGYDISITKGYFTSTMVFRVSSQRFEVLP